MPSAIILRGGLERQVVLDASHGTASPSKARSGYTSIYTLDDDVLHPTLGSWVHIVEHRLVGITSGHAGNQWTIIFLVQIGHTIRIRTGNWGENNLIWWFLPLLGGIVSQLDLDVCLKVMERSAEWTGETWVMFEKRSTDAFVVK